MFDIADHQLNHLRHYNITTRLKITIVLASKTIPLYIIANLSQSVCIELITNSCHAPHVKFAIYGGLLQDKSLAYFQVGVSSPVSC